MRLTTLNNDYIRTFEELNFLSHGYLMALPNKKSLITQKKQLEICLSISYYWNVRNI